MAMTPSSFANIVASALLLVFGFAVLALSRRRASDIAFFVYTIGFAAGTAVSNLQGDGLLSSSWEVVRSGGYVTGAAGAVGLGLALSPSWRGGTRAPALVAGAFGAIVFITYWAAGNLAGFNIGATGTTTAFGLLLAAPLFAAVLFGLDHRSHARDAAERRDLTVLAGALVAYPALYLGGTATALAPSSLAGTLFLLLAMFAVLGVGAVWLRAAARGGESAGPRNVVLVAAAFAALGAATFPTCGGDNGCGSPAITRFLAVGILAYAILRHQALGLDVKVRFALSKSTLAAVFIAVFFIASEAAQQFFGETLGSNYIGIAAAGMLVFAMSPLQRAAERLAEKAVPVTTSPPSTGSPASAAGASEREDIYRDALQFALRDRRLTREEEAKLHRLAEAIGLRPHRAHELLTELERQQAPDATRPVGAVPAEREKEAR